MVVEVVVFTVSRYWSQHYLNSTYLNIGIFDVFTLNLFLLKTIENSFSQKYIVENYIKIFNTFLDNSLLTEGKIQN